MANDTLPPASARDDMVAPFQLEGRPVVGRLVRLGAAIDDVLGRHDYPEPIANLLGEACALAALVGAALKFEGRLILQAQGDGPVRFVVADYDTSGALRGYCRFDAERLAALTAVQPRPGAEALLGQGAFVMTLDQGPDRERHQGVTPIEGDSLAGCAEAYFAQSEQIPTRIRLAVGRLTDAEGTRWRAGGVMTQLIAGDAARGDTSEHWDHARALVETVAGDELLDPMITPETLLFRLFHEEGARLLPGKPIRGECRCSEERVAGMLRSFPAEERTGLAEDDGLIHVTCEYCSRTYALPPEGL